MYKITVFRVEDDKIEVEATTGGSYQDIGYWLSERELIDTDLYTKIEYIPDSVPKKNLRGAGFHTV